MPRRDSLIGAYPDLAEDRGLLERMTKANELVRRAARSTIRGVPRKRSHAASDSVLLWPSSAACCPHGQSRAAGPTPPLAYALVDGFLYGLDALTGKPLWVQPAGLSAPFPPRPIPGSSSVLAFDARFDELVRSRRPDRSALWREASANGLSTRP